MPLSDLPQPGWAPPNVNVPLPTLSPPFLSPDDAARFAHELIGDHRDVQYGGAILKNKREQYFATRPVRGAPSLFRPERVMSTNPLGRFRHPPGYTCVAFITLTPTSMSRFTRSTKIGPAKTYLSGSIFFRLPIFTTCCE